MYQSQELMDTSLHKVIHSRVPYGPDHVQAFMYQLLCAVNYLHSLDIVHRSVSGRRLPAA